ncbi:hypothetical protein BSFA1_79420 (plasmid) [Burkholderia sp. SFA1]|uniref:Transmembrane protein n=1 Tax=Burkholderia vietnamiensis (strain G4 / LMG 22486) TaxID=269482 RepID=A4JTW4_BURVG|nr:conserved hypothetical protein [Burkholderia vietnamiensis G4]AET95210.1 hypothetical protein BYI23_E000490 [Burkholderia sp. YI23]MCB4350124.1 hypothetical protein [Burkholderia vietnamiensis]BBQ02814.1 hypothetical protein BSFA1_79420 [Burkholderia sp. SFA1]
MPLKRQLLFGSFYIAATASVVFITAHPKWGLWWVSTLLVFVMIWPFLVKHHFGKFGFAMSVQTLPGARDEPETVSPEIERPRKRRASSSIDMVRAADREARAATSASNIDLSDIPLPAGYNKTNYPPKKSPRKATSSSKSSRVAVSKESVPVAPTLPSVSDEPSLDEAQAYWQSKHQRRARHPDEFSLPLFPEQETALNEQVVHQDVFL